MSTLWNNSTSTPRSYQNKYNVSDTAGDVFNNGVAGWADDFHSFTMFGDTNASSDLLDEILGINSQKREFAQQEYLQDKMNAYNAPKEQMKRMKEAGINPLNAASGIAQGGNESAQAPAVSSNTSGPAQGISAAAGLISGLGTAAQGFAGAMETKQLLGANYNKLNAETIANLEAAGLSHWNAVSVATMLPYMEANGAADFYLKLAQYDKTHQEYVNLLVEHDKILSDIDLNSATMDLMEQQRLKEAEMTRWYKQENDFFAAHGYRPDNPLDVSLRNSVVTGRSDEAEAIGTSIETASNRAALGAYSAESEKAFDIAYNNLAGITSSEYDYAEVKAWIDANKQLLLNSADLITKAPDSIRGAAFKFMFAILNAANSHINTGHDALTKPDRPQKPK